MKISVVEKNGRYYQTRIAEIDDRDHVVVEEVFKVRPLQKRKLREVRRSPNGAVGRLWRRRGQRVSG